MWKTYEHDRFRLAANTTTAETEQTQKTTTRINGMRNKLVSTESRLSRRGKK